MARRSSFASTLTRVAREAARQQKEVERERLRQVREAERNAIRSAKQAERDRVATEKDAHQSYLENRAAEAEASNAELAERLDALRHILDHTLTVDDAISFASLRRSDSYPALRTPLELLTPIGQPNREDFFRDIKQPGRLTGWLGITRKAYEEAVAKAEAQFDEAKQRNAADEAARQAKLAHLQQEYEEKKQAFLTEVARQNQEIDEFEAVYGSGDPEGVVAYNAMVLERSEYPEGLPQEFRLAYVPDAKELVIEYELPGTEIVPAVAEYRYIKTKDSIEEKPRKAAEIKEIYGDVVTGVALRTVHEVLEADQASHLDVVVFNGFVQTVDPATGRDIRPCLISIRTTRDRFLEIDLRRIDKRHCLRNLGAQVSPRPAEMQAVKPIVEFEMVDKRFVEQSDILADLESRPNLLELNPFEFENLVSNLFSRMGLDTRQTRSSRDGGVDCVAFDTRPVLGGKVVIQAKRYSNTVGVSAVRDLYGTMMNEGANKGILVATSSYGPDAYDFAKDKPIELIDGGGLLYLLEQNGIKAHIVFPDTP